MSDTVRAHDLDAAAYATGTAPMTDSVRADIEDVLDRVGAGGSVLEIGSGSGRDAQVMEDLGLVVRRTDITPGFVHLLRAASFKEGDGDGWSTHGAVRNPRHFTYWRSAALAREATGAGWVEVGVRAGLAGTRGETWLELTAVRG